MKCVLVRASEDNARVDGALQSKRPIFETSPSGGAGYAGLIDAMNQNQLELNSSSNVMLFLTEIPA